MRISSVRGGLRPTSSCFHFEVFGHRIPMDGATPSPRRAPMHRDGGRQGELRFVSTVRPCAERIDRQVKSVPGIGPPRDHRAPCRESDAGPRPRMGNQAPLADQCRRPIARRVDLIERDQRPDQRPARIDRFFPCGLDQGSLGIWELPGSVSGSSSTKRRNRSPSRSMVSRNMLNGRTKNPRSGRHS